ncbi:hypothetical protein HHK36_024388 [Tetracentron sinense]|uniref:PROP1-like PPR domain-containing protein n=1 Tax=Tetracentron sinense TaxID=13715 RepID=A0A834YQK1_TETSI|nr:hypothetical protein HHK36_024388 [Tetracentron sinense]
MQLYDAYRVVDEMRKCGIGPNSQTYDIILHHLIKDRRSKEAHSVFQRMCGEPGCKPSLSPYTIKVRMFYNEKRVDMALRVWDQMKDKGVLPSQMYNINLKQALLDEGKNDIAQILDNGGMVEIESRDVDFIENDFPSRKKARMSHEFYELVEPQTEAENDSPPIINESGGMIFLVLRRS